KDKDSLGGFRTAINLSEMINGKPLKQGIYKIYIKLEQLLNENDDVKYEKIIPISDIKKYLTNGILTTHLEYFSASNTMKYNLIGEFDTNHKTLKFENVLLQSFNPKEVSRDEENHYENRYVKSIKKRFFKISYLKIEFLPVRK